MPTERRIARMKQVLRNRQRDLTVVFENIHDPHNVSAILRSCDAVGVSAVHLLYTREKFPALAKKTSASAKKWIDIVRDSDYQSLRERLTSAGFTLYAAHVDPAAMSIYEVDWTRPAALIMGNEHRGVSPEALAIADHTVYIPMFGMIESLNVSVAAAVILYEAARQRLAAGRYPARTETDQWLQAKLKEWASR